jgi:hypothetical protein
VVYQIKVFGEVLAYANPGNAFEKSVIAYEAYDSTVAYATALCVGFSERAAMQAHSTKRLAGRARLA